MQISHRSSDDIRFSSVQTAAYALVCMIALAAPLAAYLPRPSGFIGLAVLLASIAGGGVLCGALTERLHRALSDLVSTVLSSATGLSGGGATAPTFAMSRIEGLIVRRQFEEAAAELTTAMYAHQGQTGAEIAQSLGDLLSLRMNSYTDAARAYGRARREWLTVRSVRGREGAVHCARRLIDLYDGPLANPAAAGVERERLRQLGL